MHSTKCIINTTDAMKARKTNTKCRKKWENVSCSPGGDVADNRGPKKFKNCPLACKSLPNAIAAHFYSFFVIPEKMNYFKRLGVLHFFVSKQLQLRVQRRVARSAFFLCVRLFGQSDTNSSNRKRKRTR